MVGLIGEYIGALTITGVITRVLHLALRRSVDKPTKSMLVCALTAPLVLIVALFTMGFGQVPNRL